MGGTIFMDKEHVSRRKRDFTFTVVGDLSAIKGRGVVVFDVDGVLVDPTERFRKSLELAGVTEDEFRASSEARRRVYKIFLSGKYVELDKPIKQAIEVLREKSRRYPIVIITSRPLPMRDATVEQLKRIGAKYDVLILRGHGRYVRDDIFKEAAIRRLGIKPLEIHDDSPRIIYRVAKYPSHGTYYWYRPGRYTYIPPLYAYVGNTKVWLYDTPGILSATIGKKEVVVRYAGKTYRFRDGVHALGFLLMQGDKLRDQYCIPSCTEYWGAATLLDVLHTIKEEGSPPRSEDHAEPDIRALEDYIARNADDIADEVATPSIMVYGPVPSPVEFNRDTLKNLLVARVKYLRGTVQVPGELRPYFEKSLYDTVYTHKITEKNGLVLAIHRGAIIAYKTYSTRAQEPRDSTGTGSIIDAIKNTHTMLVHLNTVFKDASTRFRKELEQLGVKDVKKIYVLRAGSNTITLGAVLPIEKIGTIIGKAVKASAREPAV